MGTELATQQAQPSRERVPLPIGLSVFLCVIAGFIVAGFYAKAWLEDEQQLPVQDIVFTGDIKMVDTDAMEKAIRNQHKGSFFAVDVNDVHANVERHPWVYNASIRKRWPSALYIHIVEQQAVAVWNSDLLLNKYGDTFEGDPESVNLPQLFGPNGSEKTALVGYNHMRILMAGSGQKIREVFLSERFAWKLRLASDVTLNLGRQEYIDRLQRFIDIYPIIEAQNKQIDYVDLRYDTGLAVGWTVAGNDNATE
ncbi:cell division protein FtsQ/DivIB [Glaciecola sp. 1036]|uniref:cell division protein FtsQ/DivIB n=1 Tax=Alteromonadaceae TaxID=72275 RepID=UPI003D073990